MNPELLHILQHSLGLDRYGQGNQYRNHFVAGGEDVIHCEILVTLGYMREGVRSPITGGGRVFQVTSRGMRAVRRESPDPPPLTRGQRRYRAYLAADCDQPFGEWLKDKDWDAWRARFGV